jgi:hypothetical protein
MGEVVRYSKAFKPRLVGDMANGKYQNLDEAQDGIRGSSIQSKWIKQYGWEDILPKRIRVETMNEIDELKAALADAHMEYRLEKSVFGYSVQATGDKYGSVKKRTS